MGIQNFQAGPGVGQPLSRQGLYLPCAFGERRRAAGCPDEIALKSGQRLSISRQPILQPLEFVKHDTDLAVTSCVRFHPVNKLTGSVGVLETDGKVPAMGIRVFRHPLESGIYVHAAPELTRVVRLYMRTILGPKGLQAGFPFSSEVRRGLDSVFENHGVSTIRIGHKMSDGFVGAAAEFRKSAPAADRVLFGTGVQRGNVVSCALLSLKVVNSGFLGRVQGRSTEFLSFGIGRQIEQIEHVALRSTMLVECAKSPENVENVR